ncbi:MAG: rhomboid family intramembrane serine protease, partial [Planctomycetota bacterium]
MLFPFNVDVPMERVPIANWIVIGLTCLVSVALLMADPRHLPDFAILKGGAEFSSLQLFGHLLTHGGTFHLFANMIFLFCFGNAVNAKLGHATFLVFYFGVGALSGGAWLVFGSGEPLVGASGAIMGVVGVFFVLYPRNDVSVFYWFLVVVGTFRCPSMGIIL